MKARLTTVLVLALGSCRDDECNEDHRLELRDAKVCFGKVDSYEFPGPAFEVRGDDLDGDGDFDIVALGSNALGESSGVIHVLRNTTGREFTAATLDIGEALEELELGDLDGDGDLDIAARATSGIVSLLANNGAAGYEIVNTINANTRSMKVSDLVGTGAAAMIAISTENTLTLTREALNPTSESIMVGQVSDDDYCLYAGEITGDGRTDLFTDNWLYPGLEEGVTQFDARVGILLQDEDCGVVVDLNVDGVDDVAFCERVQLMPFSSHASPTEIPGFAPFQPGTGCIGTAITRGRSIAPTFVAFSDNIDNGSEDGPISPLCRSITAAIPDVGSKDSKGREKFDLGVFEKGGRSEQWTRGVLLADIDGDGAVDIIEPRRGGASEPVSNVLELTFGRICK